MKLGKGVSEPTSSGSDTPQRNWNNPPDILRRIPVKVSVEDGKISKQPATNYVILIKLFIPDRSTLLIMG